MLSCSLYTLKTKNMCHNFLHLNIMMDIRRLWHCKLEAALLPFAAKKEEEEENVELHLRFIKLLLLYKSWDKKFLISESISSRTYKYDSKHFFCVCRATSRRLIYTAWFKTSQKLFQQLCNVYYVNELQTAPICEKATKKVRVSEEIINETRASFTWNH